MVTDAAAGECLRRLAPDLVAMPRERVADGSDKSVWFVGDHHMLRIARHEAGGTRMTAERTVLAALDGRLGPVSVPEVVAVSEDAAADVCRRAEGVALDWRAWATVAPEHKAALAAPLGEALGVLHDTFDTARSPALDLPPPRLVAVERLDLLRGRTGTAAREALLTRVLDAWGRDRRDGLPDVVLHGDLGLHNLSLDPTSLALRGIFDFGEASRGDPHFDLRYDPTFEVGGLAMVRAYEATRGVALSASRQALLHAAAALDNLLHSIDHEGPDLLARRQAWVDAVAAWDPGRINPEIR